MIGTFGPYMSRVEHARRGCRACASATARFTATVVLPTPPLPAPTAMMFLTPSTGARPPSGRAAARTCAVISTSTAGRAKAASSIARAWSRIRSLTGQAGVVSSIVNATRPSVNAHVLDESERDDVLVQIGIVHRAQCVEHRGFGQGGHALILSCEDRAGRRPARRPAEFAPCVVVEEHPERVDAERRAERHDDQIGHGKDERG